MASPEGKPIEFASPSVTEDDVAAVVRVLRSGWLTTGPECERLEDELCQYTGAPHAVAVSSCTAALEIALAWIAPAPGSLVLVPGWTFASTALSAVRVGAIPLLVDIDPDTLNLDPSRVAEALDRRDLSAAVPVHLGGVPVSASVLRLLEDAGVPVIEDAAHALGASDHRGPINGRDVVAACLSFYVTKNLTSAEGGAILTWSEDLDHFARSYRLHGLDRDAWARYRPGAQAEYDLVHPGIKANLPDVLAALARSQLQRFDEMQRRRRSLVKRYRANLSKQELVRPIPREMPEGSADHLFMVELDESRPRSKVQERLDEAGIRTSVHFRPLHTYRWFSENAVIPDGGLPVCDRLAERVLSLPLHPNLTDADVDRVCETLLEVIG